MRLDPWLRRAVYAAYAALLASGVVWFICDQLKESAAADLWQQIGAQMLMLHGGTAMLALLLIGALFPVHIRGGWRLKRNRPLGAGMIALNAVLILTAFALYYLGSETLRPWISGIHFYVGLAAAPLLAVHIVLGRRTAPPDPKRKPTPPAAPPGAARR